MTTKLASDAFLPTGGLDINHHFHTASSPHSSNRLPPTNQSHANGSSYNSNIPSIFSRLPSAFPPSTLPPSNPNDLLPPSGQSPPPSQQRYRSSLSPTRQTARHYPAPYQSSPPDVNGASYLYRSVSADATSSSPTHAPNHLVQRLAQQNALIREAWEAERNYLEANRRRAEEVYQEERIIMEEVREAWENEKAALLRENQTLKERIQRLEGENTALKAVAAQQGAHAPGLMSPLSSQRGDSVDASTESGPIGHSIYQNISQQGIAPVADLTSLPPGLDGASRRPRHLSPGSSRTSPVGQPESSPFIPLDPRMQPQTQNPKDFLAPASRDKEESAPVIDVREVHPKLEGIPLKANALQRPTFGASNKSSPATSPPPVADAGQAESRHGLKRLSPKDQTIQVLRAEESRRLTMHAGHTPNHSLSLFPTMSVAGGSTAATHDGDTAPSQGAPSAPPEQEEETAMHEAPEQRIRETETAEHGHDEDQHRVHGDGAEDPEERFEATGDVRLKGPLMVKNIPAQDEIFWDQVNKKLEPISHGRDALPTVMRSSFSDEDAAGPSGTQHLPRHQGRSGAPMGGDVSHSLHAGIEDTEEDVGDEKGVEGDVPLKLKTTTNFGAPFGVA